MGPRRLKIVSVIREILGDAYLNLRVDRFTYEEDVATSECRVRCELHHEASGVTEIIEGVGVGVIDAFFHGLKDHLAQEYPSLDTIRIISFSVRGEMDSGEKPGGADAAGVVEMVVKNSNDVRFDFEHRSRSVAGSAIQLTLQVVEYFVNSELAFVQAYKALQDATIRSRQDLVDVYTLQLSELVKNTSYSRVIEDIRRELGLN